MLRIGQLSVEAKKSMGYLTECILPVHRQEQHDDDRHRRQGIDLHLAGLDMDWFYRMGGRFVLRMARGPIQSTDSFVGESYRRSGIAWMTGAAAILPGSTAKLSTGLSTGWHWRYDPWAEN